MRSHLDAGLAVARAAGQAALLALGLLAAPALADHPGAERIDDVMAGKEPAFEATDLQMAPELDVVTAGGGDLRLDALADHVVVLSFVPETFGDPCAAQQRTLDEVRRNLDATPMREMVTFVAVSDRRAGASAQEAANWRAVEPASGLSAGTSAERFAALSTRADGSPQVHLIARGGRHAAIFHGREFEPLNMVLYINGLTNEAPAPAPGLLDRLLELFR